MDISIRQGFEWLIRAIEMQWSTLHQRVTKDVDEKMKQEEREKKERMERVRKSRELRLYHLVLLSMLRF